MNPRAGCPTYTLSRGASSASWVFLRSNKKNIQLHLNAFLCQTRISLYQRKFKMSSKFIQVFSFFLFPLNHHFSIYFMIWYYKHLARCFGGLQECIASHEVIIQIKIGNCETQNWNIRAIIHNKWRW